MFFVDREHEHNFRELMFKFPHAQQDRQYQAGFYIVAYPEIYLYCNGNPVCDGNGPFDWFVELDIGGLSTGVANLAKAGFHLYNNFDEFSLFLSLSTWCERLFSVFMQACEIKRNLYNLKG